MSLSYSLADERDALLGLVQHARHGQLGRKRGRAARAGPTTTGGRRWRWPWRTRGPFPALGRRVSSGPAAADRTGAVGALPSMRASTAAWMGASKMARSRQTTTTLRSLFLDVGRGALCKAAAVASATTGEKATTKSSLCRALDCCVTSAAAEQISNETRNSKAAAAMVGGQAGALTVCEIDENSASSGWGESFSLWSHSCTVRSACRLDERARGCRHGSAHPATQDVVGGCLSAPAAACLPTYGT